MANLVISRLFGPDGLKDRIKSLFLIAFQFLVPKEFLRKIAQL